MHQHRVSSQPNHIAASVIDEEDLLKRTFEILMLLDGLIHGGDSIAKFALRSYAFASLRNHSIASR